MLNINQLSHLEARKKGFCNFPLSRAPQDEVAPFTQRQTSAEGCRFEPLSVAPAPAGGRTNGIRTTKGVSGGLERSPTVSATSGQASALADSESAYFVSAP